MSETKPATARFEGLGASAGIAIGHAVCIENRVYTVSRFPLEPGTEERELERFRRSVDRAQEEIRETGHRVREQLGNELAAIFEAHSLFLADRLFLERIEERIVEEGVNAEWAVHRIAAELGERFAALESPHLRERAEDLQDVSRYLLRSLQDQEHRDLSEVDGDIVVIASDLTPSDAVRLGRQGVVGFAIETGGETSHTAIIARSLHLPLVVGLSGLTSRVRDEDSVIVDGTGGIVFQHPDAARIERYRERQERELQRRKRLLATRELESETLDGVKISLLANIDLPEEIDEALEFGVEGVGLYRSEFLYIERSPDMPTEDEQIELYERLLTAMAPHPVTVRTYDLGGRKLAREVMGTAESNPVLGLRGIRLTMARPKIFRVQLRALFRAAVSGELRIMLPMVSTLEEIHEFKRFAASIVDELAEEGVEHRPDVKVGIMIEVPSAAMVADQLAGEVDFFSIGTNDLIQYSLAVDRNNEHVNYLYRPSHPAILRMIRFVVDSARAAGIGVTICGEMAGDPDNTALLLGLGLRHLSVGPHTVPSVKAKIRGVSVERCRAAVDRCLELGTAGAVEEALQELSAAS
jgi:phosphotransferase system enzyme I (PtsI)